MGFIQCDCEVYEICPSCAPSEPTYAKAAAANDEAARRVHSPAPSYTLAEIEALAKEWAIETKRLASDRWLVSNLVAWLARREREAGDG